LTYLRVHDHREFGLSKGHIILLRFHHCSLKLISSAFLQPIRPYLSKR
jgi:hypothetical protein